MKSYSLWINKKKQAKIYQKKLVYNKNNKTVFYYQLRVWVVDPEIIQILGHSICFVHVH